MGAEAPGEEAYAAQIYAETGAAVVSQGQGAAEGIGQRVRLESGNPVQDAENQRYREKEESLWNGSTPPHLHCLRRVSSSFPWLCFLTRSSSGFHFASDFCCSMAL